MSCNWVRKGHFWEVMWRSLVNCRRLFFIVCDCYFYYNLMFVILRYLELKYFKMSIRPVVARNFHRNRSLFMRIVNNVYENLRAFSILVSYTFFKWDRGPTNRRSNTLSKNEILEEIRYRRYFVLSISVILARARYDF